VSGQLEVAPGAEDLLQELGWGSLAAVLAESRGEVVAQSQSSSTVCLTTPGGDQIYLKRYRYPRRLWRHSLRPCRALREWRALQLLRQEGTPAPEPLAWGEERQGLRLYACALVTRGLPETRNAAELLEEEELTLSLLRAGVDAIARLHEKGLAHRDLFLRNILVQGIASATPRLAFLDAARGGRHPGAWLEDLVHLDLDLSGALSPSRRLVLLRRYLRHRGDAVPVPLLVVARKVAVRRRRLQESIRRRDERQRRRRVRKGDIHNFEAGVDSELR
jgi:hypothetical protein